MHACSAACHIVKTGNALAYQHYGVFARLLCLRLDCLVVSSAELPELVQ